MTSRRVPKALFQRTPEFPPSATERPPGSRLSLTPPFQLRGYGVPDVLQRRVRPRARRQDVGRAAGWDRAPGRELPGHGMRVRQRSHLGENGKDLDDIEPNPAREIGHVGVFG